MRIAVIMPCFGEHHLTDAALEDFSKQEHRYFALYLVDNKKDYPWREREWPKNWRHLETDGLRWLRGTNYGTLIARSSAVYRSVGYDGYLWINNDVRLSDGFLAGLVEAVRAWPGRVGIVAPSYNDVWQHQVPQHYNGPAAGYRPLQVEQGAKFVDGACFLVTEECIRTVGTMDAKRFGRFGWGGDLDYCIRARQAGLDVIVTQRAYYNHIGGGTNKLLESNYLGEAGSEMHAGMTDKYGPDWEELIR